MWALNNESPFAAERTWVRDETGAEVWLVAVRGTFLVEPTGALRLAPEQEPVCRVAAFRGAPLETSIVHESDLVHCKGRTDVLLNGHAYAPGGGSASRVDVSLRIGAMRKRLCVFGDRWWSGSALGMRMSAPRPFARMPIVYERAFGGTDTTASRAALHDWEPRNPVGAGFAVRPQHLEGRLLPNVELAGALIKSWNDRPAPAGFGAIAAFWQPRVRLAGTYGDDWKNKRSPLLPTDFDRAFYQCAPADQQASGHLVGGEDVELENLSPPGHMRFRIPRVSFNFFTSFRNRSAVNHRAVIHTVCIEPDVPRVLITWHTSLPCHRDVHRLLETTITMKHRLTGEELRDVAVLEKDWA